MAIFKSAVSVLLALIFFVGSAEAQVQEPIVAGDDEITPYASGEHSCGNRNDCLIDGVYLSMHCLSLNGGECKCYSRNLYPVTTDEMIEEQEAAAGESWIRERGCLGRSVKK